jgi:ribonuclease T
MSWHRHPVISKRFRGYLPVVVDVETGGLHHQTDALLELAASIIEMDEYGRLSPGEIIHYHINPFPGARLDPESLKLNRIDPTHPFRFALDEREALNDFFQQVSNHVKRAHCDRAVLVGHNAWFDLFFLNAASTRCEFKQTPFHRFTSLDTASISAIALGQTVLAKAVKAAGLSFNPEEAHSAIYDCQKTADLFCYIANNFKLVG